MNTRTAMAAIAAAACLTLTATACGPSGTGQDNNPKPKAAKNSSKPKASKSDDVCGPNSELSQQDWIDLCEKGQGLGAESDAKPKALGQSQTTVGDSNGDMQVTPTTVLDATTATGETPDLDLFTIVTVKDKAVSGVPAAEAAPISGGGWKWVAKDGQTIDDGDGNAAFNVVPSGFEGGGDVQPGTYDWRVAVFDLTKAQRKGGTLMYVDGGSVSYRWTMPAGDSGPQLAELKQGITG